MRVIVVSVGEYSDYIIRGIFSSFAKAHAFKTKLPEEWNVDLEVELDYEAITPLLGRRIFEMTILKNGYIVENQMIRTNTVSALNANEHKGHFQNWCWEGERCLNKPENVLVITVWGENAQHAVDVVREIRTRLVATNTWAKYSDLKSCWKEALQ